MGKISVFFILTFFVLSNSYSMKESIKKESIEKIIKKEKKSIKLKIKIDPKEALLKGREYYTQENYDLAYKYFKYAAKRDSVGAQLEYATMLFDGYGCKKDLIKSLEIINIVIKKTAATKDDDIDFKNIYRVAKTLWYNIINDLALELMEPNR